MPPPALKHLIFAALALIALLTTTAFAQNRLTRWDDFYDSVKRDLRSKLYAEQLAAVEKFRSQDCDEAAEYLVKMIQHERGYPGTLSKAGEVLGGYRDERARRWVSDAVRRKPEASPHLLTAYVLQGHDDRKAVALTALERAESPPVQATAIRLLAALPDPDTELLDRLIVHLEEDCPHSVRKATADAFGRVKSRAVISPLIECLDDKVVGVWARDSLFRLTGEKHWLDREAWRGWWESQDPSWIPTPMDEPEYAVGHAKLVEEMGGAAMQADFYEREITGKNMLFLLDVSGSMNDPTDELGGTRIKTLKEELSFLVSRLDAEYSLGLILFPHDTFPTRGLDPVDEDFREKAERFIDRMFAEGDTPMGSAMEFAFEKVVPRNNVDTIYLISDGSPTDATDDEILKPLLVWLDRYGVTIHCVSIGEDSELLKAIAEMSDGQYWEVH